MPSGTGNCWPDFDPLHRWHTNGVTTKSAKFTKFPLLGGDARGGYSLTRKYLEIGHPITYKKSVIIPQEPFFLGSRAPQRHRMWIIETSLLSVISAAVKGSDAEARQLCSRIVKGDTNYATRSRHQKN